jgi:hypothetical protein
MRRIRERDDNAPLAIDPPADGGHLELLERGGVGVSSPAPLARLPVIFRRRRSQNRT